VNDTIPKNKKEITTIDVRKSIDKKINEITLTYSDGTSETLSENEATERGLINNDYGNHGRGSLKVISKSNTQIKDNLSNALYILDGKEVTNNDIGKLDPNFIESINVLKGASAIAAYGEKGKDGVVEIKTKKMGSGDRRSLPQDADTNRVNANREVTVIGFKTHSSKVTVNEPVFTKAEFAPTIDQDEWRRFLEKYTQPIIQEAGKTVPAGKYTVNVEFIIEKDGSVSNIRILNDPGYGIGPKILEMMKHAPKWKPAIQNQRVVRAMHRQPITFVISDDKSDPSTTLEKGSRPAKVYKI
ncbi:MAG TPA: energy transducer TonB, partial [Flavisolibacter sp.]